MQIRGRGAELVPGEGGVRRRGPTTRSRLLSSSPSASALEAVEQILDGARVHSKRKSPCFRRGFCYLNRATSYAPTQLPVQYHRG